VDGSLPAVDGSLTGEFAVPVVCGPKQAICAPDEACMVPDGFCAWL